MNSLRPVNWQQRYRDLHAAGKKDHQIAVELGVCRATARNMRVDLGLPPHPRAHYPSGWKRTLQELHAQGLQDPQIARQMRISRRQVHRLRMRLGLSGNTPDPVTRRKLCQTGQRWLTPERSQEFNDRRRNLRWEQLGVPGWPVAALPVGTQILQLLWDFGPMTRRQIQEGLRQRYGRRSASLQGLARGGDFVCHLMQLGYVQSLGRVARDPDSQRRVEVYCLAPQISPLPAQEIAA